MTAPSPQSLPDDIDALKTLLLKKEQRIHLLEEQIRLFKQKRFGSSSEKSDQQAELFNEAELIDMMESASEAEALESAAPAQREAAPRKAKPGRKPLPADLPRIRIEHDLPDADKVCTCGCVRDCIGEDTSEQLDIIPAKVQVLVNVRKKYACKQCEGNVSTAPLPPQPIPKSKASPGLLAHIAVAKYQDALPLYRQEGILGRSDIDLPRHTLALWMVKAGQLAQPLINLLQDHLLSYPVLRCDETTVQVLKEPGKEAQSHSYMWVRVGGPPTQTTKLYHYADSRRGEVAQQLLMGYQGYVQTDDYAGYNGACAQAGITQLGCWAHARRKFVEAQKAVGKQKKAGKVDMAVSMIAKLYAIEKRAETLSPEARYTLRQQESVPQLQAIRVWLDKTLHTTLPKGLLGKALSYLEKNWSKLTVYTQDGRLGIDNNPAENAIRPFVVGRKNWLFSASTSGATASANLYSLIETAKANGLEPFAYLKRVFTELPRAQGLEDIEALLPWQMPTMAPEVVKVAS